MLARLGGGLLVLAGVVKLAFTGPPAPSAVTAAFFPDWALALVPAYEIALGGWLIADRLRFGAWIVTLFTLTAFSLVNLGGVTAGQTSCGCLGPLSPPPGVMLALDIAAGMLLLKHRPGWAGWPAGSPGLRLAAMTAGVVAITLGIAAGLAFARYGSIAVALADARGDAVAVTPVVVEIGLAEPDAEVERTVTLHNLTEESVQVLLARANCQCATFDGLPRTVEPGGRGEVRARVRVPVEPGLFRRAGAFRTTAGDVPFEIRGVVRGVSPTAGAAKSE